MPKFMVIPCIVATILLSMVAIPLLVFDIVEHMSATIGFIGGVIISIDMVGGVVLALLIAGSAK